MSAWPRFLTIIPLLVSIGAPASDSQMPHVLRTEPSVPHAAWVSANRAFTLSGELDSTLVSSDAAESIKRILARPESAGCIRVGMRFEDYVNPPRRSTIAQALQTAEYALTGRVTGQLFGFFHGNPGQLVEVEPETMFKGKLPASKYYFFLPIGEFESNGKRICKTDTRYAAAPNIGDQVVLFAVRLGSGQSGNFLDIFDEGGFLSIDSDGAVSFPQRYRRSPSIEPLAKADYLLLQLRKDAVEE